tara:strand:- start:4580 stop:5602 length:1023 start_codon:yes stop_codon:yes gene_type:complete
MPRTAEIVLDYQNYIDGPPLQKEQLFSNACANDAVTIKSWFQTWVDNIKANKETLGSFADHSVGKLHGLNKYGTAVCVGSGPSLGYNAKHLKNKGLLPTVSCLHNFHFMEDNGISADYYVSLDAGPIVITEVAEGGSKTSDEYWEMTRDRKLVAYIGSHPDLFKKWQGDIYVFNAPVPDPAYVEAVNAVEPFSVYLSNGGNVLGACLYFSKAILGVDRVAMLGADFCFGYDKTSFHAWPSSYDKGGPGVVVPMTDVFGIKVPSWPSYRNFKYFFDYLSLQIPGNWMVNCSEGGCLGSYPEGNIRSITQMPLNEFLGQQNMCENIRECIDNPGTQTKQLVF